ncbi:MAG: alpha/beta fold hydrolase [Anaerolineales bacterium]|jgi:carboxylesterase
MPHLKIINTAEPFLFPAGPVGCVLTHGFTGTPKEMRLLGEYLHKQGFTVLGIRLAGHATSLEDMMRMRAEDWLASVEDGYHMLKSHCDSVFLIGLSMGGVLSLIQAARLPVNGVAALSTLYDFPVRWVQKVPWMMRVISPFMPTQAKNENTTWFNPDMAEEHISYPKHPVRSAYELYRLLKRLQATLPDIQLPTLLIHSKDDDYVTAEHAEKIYANLGAPEKELVWVERCRHVITRDGQTSRVFEPVEGFVRQYSNGKD